MTSDRRISAPGPDGPRARTASAPPAAPPAARRELDRDRDRRYVRAVEGWLAGRIRTRAHELRRLRPGHATG